MSQMTSVPGGPPPAASGSSGCGMTCLVVMLVVAGICLLAACCGGGIVWIVFGALRESEPYQMALTAVQQDAEVRKELGEPIEEGWITGGSINVNGDGSGEANFTFNVTGPKGTGTAEVHATRQRGKWRLDTLVVETPEREIEVIDGGPPAMEPGEPEPDAGPAPPRVRDSERLKVPAAPRN